MEEGYVLVENQEIPSLPSSCTIFVSNVSKKANEKSLREFFGICGQIKTVQLEDAGENQNALIVFENDEAAKTAIFLNDTFMFDGTINVIPYSEHVGTEQPSNNNSPNNTNVQQQGEQPQQNSFWVNSLASAYMFGNKAWKKVIEFDDKHKISATINEKANQLDQNFKISERSKIAAQKLGEFADNIDNSFAIKDKTQKISTKTTETLTNLRERNEKTQTFFQKLDEVGKKIGNTWEDTMKRAQEKIEIVKVEIKRREEEEGGKNGEVVQMQDLDKTNENSSLIENEQLPPVNNEDNSNNTKINYNNDLIILESSPVLTPTTQVHQKNNNNNKNKKK
eukprot:TRINITY_DN2293_c1_g1_i1.p1 TRINITY_DN2293_c1_g1~~TRINITY_DN2293_c1_g1_i1.p1  ORF type:complete len:337 (-),score=134.40 TRINITY_DN2293_c1_g1_i1:91-1101(-)